MAVGGDARGREGGVVTITFMPNAAHSFATRVPMRP